MAAESPIQLIRKAASPCGCSDWQTPGDRPLSGDGEFFILLSTGGPATRVFGSLEDGEPTTVEFQAQDWFEPWRNVDLYEYEQMPNDSNKPVVLRGLSAEEIRAHLLTYCRCFYWRD